ncbi:MAG: 3-isopropylmalate dehydratase small subunit [Candidatus Diapherotrites archaeon]|nr:3-isopropylmalate dehydratase small subunit [Candidatus Diapherotrites archaeon]
MNSEIKSLKGTAIPKISNDQNTDDIIPARYLKEITFKNMGKYVYFDERFKNGIEIKEHQFNNAKFKGASILIAGANYGCGSSREHAPQALHRFGIKAIIAESFAEIFAGNCASLGVVGVTLPAKEIAALAQQVEKEPKTELSISLQDKTISFAGKKLGFEIPEGKRQSFLNGTWDAMAVLKNSEQEIEKVAEKLDYLKYE